MIPFEDMHTHDGGRFYWAPNEEPLVFRELLENIHVKRAAAICSAGEVGLFGILPSVRHELVLVDHCYRSLAIAMIKYLLLRERGWEDARRLLTTSQDTAELQATIETLLDHLPEVVRQKSFRSTTRGHWDFHNVKPFVNSYGTLISEIHRHWSETSELLVKRAARRINRINFVHGDLTDVTDKGPFDLVYISNAFAHTDRNGRYLSAAAQKIEQLLKPGGLVVGVHTDVARNRKWETVAQRARTSWTHVVYRVPERSVLA